MKGLSVKNRATRVSAILIAMIVAAAAAPSCSGDSNQSSGQEKIGPEGGTVSAPGGASVVIPPGALSEETTITVTPITEENMSELVPELVISHGGADFGPDGITFDKPVTISFPLDQQLPEGSQFPLYLYDKASGSFRETEFIATVGDGGTSVSAEVTHFSVFLSLMTVSSSILAAVQNYIGDGSDPHTSLVNYANWFINEAVKPYDFWANTNGCCYTFVGVFFDLTYKRDDVEFTSVINDGESSTLEQQLFYESDYESNGHRYILHIRVHLYIAVEPDLALEIGDPELKKDETTQVTATLTCNGEPMVGNDITFSVEANGSVNPGSKATNSNGKASVTFVAEDEGTATVNANHDAGHCQGNQSSFGMSDNINIGESDSWRGTATYSRILDNGCWREEAYYSVAFNFTVHPSYGVITGTATAEQDVTAEIIDHAYCIGNLDVTMAIENIQAPETLDLVVDGYYNHIDDVIEYLQMTIDLVDNVDFYDFDLCSDSSGSWECSSASGDTARTSLWDMWFENLPPVETTTIGADLCDETFFSCVVDWTITLEKAK